MQNFGTLIGCLFFHSKMVTMILQIFFDKYYMSLVEIKDFNALTYEKLSFDQLF